MLNTIIKVMLYIYLLTQPVSILGLVTTTISILLLEVYAFNSGYEKGFNSMIKEEK